MRQPRKLSLKRETLTPLTTDEMAAVAGGSHLCVTEYCTTGVGHGPSFEYYCPTLPLNECVYITYKTACN